MIRIIKSLLNINKKLYIIVNDKVADKGKLARACATIGMRNPNFLLSSTIVVKGGCLYDDLRTIIKNNMEWYKEHGSFFSRIGKCKFSGEHIDAGYTQVKAGTSLAFGVIVNKKDKIKLPLL